MSAYEQPLPVVGQVCPAALAAFRCPAQVLVVDRPNGPAHILLDSISRLLEGEIAFTLADDCTGTLRALENSSFDLIAFGLDGDRLEQLTFMGQLRRGYPHTPLLLVGREMTRQRRQWAWHQGVQDVVELPQRAADLKTLVNYIAGRYLDI